MSTPEIAAVIQALMADLTSAFGALTPDKAAAFFPGAGVDDQVVQNGAVNMLRLGQWLATFDTPIVVRPGQTQMTTPPGGASATAIYSAVVTRAQPADASSLAGQQLTRRIAADKTLLGQVALEEPLGCEPPDWPLPSASCWRTASTVHKPSKPDPADPANTVVRLPGDQADDDFFIATWEKAVGDPVESGQVLAEAEDVKVTFDIESPVTGTLLEIIVPAGDPVKKGDPIAIIGPGQPPPPVIVDYQYTVVSLTRRVAGTPWWDDVLLSDPSWFVPGRTAGGLLQAPPAGTVNALPYALLVVRNVVISGPGQQAGELGWAGMQAIGLVANVLPPLPPKDDPALPAVPGHALPARQRTRRRSVAEQAPCWSAYANAHSRCHPGAVNAAALG